MYDPISQKWVQYTSGQMDGMDFVVVICMFQFTIPHWMVDPALAADFDCKCRGTSALTCIYLLFYSNFFLGAAAYIEMCNFSLQSIQEEIVRDTKTY